MNSILKRSSLLALSLLITLTLVPAVRAIDSQLKVVTNSGVTDIKAVSIDGTLYIEAKRVLEEFGSYVFWNPETNVLAVNTHDGRLVTYALGSNILFSDGTTGTISKTSKTLEFGVTYMPIEMVTAIIQPNVISSTANAVYIYRYFQKNVLTDEILKQIPNCDNYNPLNFERYVAYQEANPWFSADKIILYVNCNADKEAYTDISTISNPESPFALVDKFHILPDGYTPELSYYDGYKWTAAAGEAWLTMKAAAKADGYTLLLDNSYRDYSSQNQLWQRRAQSDGEEYADSGTARAGHSEHNLGYTADFQGTNNFPQSNAYNWVTEHAHEYGFIVSYTAEKGFIHRYKPEPWHIRWFPQYAADIMWAEGLTLQEYENLYLNPASHGFVINRELAKTLSERDFAAMNWHW
jgi:LAS superfamily LD-carboxypeptidase LdcB